MITQITTSAGAMRPRSAATWLAFLLISLLFAVPASAQERAKIRKEIGSLDAKIEKLDQKIARAEKALGKEKSTLAKKHRDAFDLKKQKKVGAVLSTLMVGQCGPDKPDRKSPEAVFGEIEPDLRRAFGRAIVKTSKSVAIEQIGLLMEGAEDPSDTRCARILGESFDASFGKEFDKAWESLKTHLSKAKAVLDLQKERKELERRKEDLETQLTANIKGNHPRGMVPVAGGKGTFGIDVEQIETLCHRSDVREDKVYGLVWSSASVERSVTDFLVDKYEITHRAYRYFCEQTDREHPNYRTADPKNPGKKKVVPIWPEGKIPEGWQKRPVFFVTFEDAVAYCEWTGCRLPTEFEFEMAARSGRSGFDGRIWPFGNDYKKYLVNDSQNHDSQLRLGLVPPKGLNYPAVLDVGAMEDSRSPLGIFDLVGNVAEWTDSPFTPHDNFKSGSFFDHKFSSTDFSSDRKALRGGHCDQDPMMANGIFRQGLLPGAKAKFVGFRRARSAAPGRDMLTRLTRNSRLDAAIQEYKLLKSDDAVEAPYPRIDFTDGRFAAIEKFEWNAELDVPGRASGILIANRLANDKKADFSSDKDIDRVTKGEDWKKDGLLLGIFHTEVPVAEPALEAGTWFVIYKSKYKKKEKGKKAKKVAASIIFAHRRPDVAPVTIKTTANTFNLNRKGVKATRIDRRDGERIDLVYSHPMRGGRKSLETFITLTFAKGALEGYE